ncbi:TlpA family protein disulfide reductase [Halomonas sp. KAO]|uniref:TlpA disulfide reductase family protein n=1 Tax=unclassified Halomonas TaxID=2609666 RepID=UPI00189D46DF|nr:MULTISPECIES: TlpA disulfide reductase family protein [unclassified Halomonas]MBF7052956.1 TlpA family protein disulfide reductase [Halomonas sp. KAO]MDT0500745.1 TlpA disulfide reductase family protein [Halomonas sp. PAR7]MDT0513065.1 TlpA disulfide reductase family protein [Halomonas sp. LES1]MDT0591524.1 TlpA disulfide reductase family protein [Halomonas sp. PAR8]
MQALNQSIAVGPMGFSIGQLLIILAFGVALLAGALIGRRHRTPTADTLFNLLLVALVGARLVFVARYWNSYDGILSMLDIRDGGFDAVGGLVAGLGYAAWRLWRSPRQRRPLGGALLAGTLAWGLTAGPLLLIEEQGRPLPDTPLTTLAGDPTALPELAEREAKPLVVNLWATWCPPCRREMPVFEQAQNEISDITFAFVNQGENVALVNRFLDEMSLDLDNVLLDAQTTLGDVTGAMAMPTTLFYDAEGQLVNTHFGELSHATLRQGLERLR